MARLSADVDPKVLEEAVRLSGARTKRETIDRALREFIARRRLQELSTLAGQGLTDMTIDELTRWRSSDESTK